LSVKYRDHFHSFCIGAKMLWHVNDRFAPCAVVAGTRGQLNQPQFQIGPIGVRVRQGPKLPPL
jgi:hypothetical protein